MLRLAPTRISLTSADLDWHIRRQGKRLVKVKNGEASTAKIDATKSSNQSPKYRSSIDSELVPSRHHRSNPVPIYSDEPVPQESEESRPFWGGILADAGVLGRDNQATFVRSSRAASPADTFLGDNTSARAPVQDEDENDWSHDGALGELQISPRSPESHPLSPESTSGSWTSASTQIQSRRTPISLPAQSPDEANAVPWPLDSSDREVNQMDVDGSSDAGPSLHHYRSTSSLQDSEPALIGMPFGAQARRAELAASRSTYADRSSYSNFSTPDRTVPGGYNPSPSSQHIRMRSGGLPRSRLYISEVVASSSPEKRQRSIIELDNPTPPDDTGSAPTRVRKRYKRRESSPYDASEASNDPRQSAYTGENPFDGPPQSSPPESITHDLDDLFASAGGTQHRYHGSQNLDIPSAYPVSMSSQSHSYSSYNDLSSYDYSLLPRQPFHPLPSAPTSTPRTPSNSLPPTYNPVDENAQSHRRHHHNPTTPTSQSSSINLHPTHISIYNDSLPSHSQPQTPHGLPRNGLPRMSLQNPFYTAPARQGGGLGQRRGPAVWNPDVFMTPTRAEGRRNVGVIGDGRPMVMRNDDQENVSREVEAERRERREQGNRERGSWTAGRMRGWRISEWEP
ncbi:MAG: hypothetical protein Q9213_007150 [Squamulea squamosa]